MRPGGRGRHWRGGDGIGPGPRHIRRFLEPIILLLLHMGPAHGYALQERMKEFGLETYPVDSSMIYRTLRFLEEEGMVGSAWDMDASAGPPRRVYELTQAGNAYLGEWVGDLRATVGLLQHFLEVYDGQTKTGPRAEQE